MAVKIPAIAANAQPVETTIHPPPSAFERASDMFAIDPLPSSTRTKVPINSPTAGDDIRLPPGCCSQTGEQGVNSQLHPRACFTEVAAALNDFNPSDTAGSA